MVFLLNVDLYVLVCGGSRNCVVSFFYACNHCKLHIKLTSDGGDRIAKKVAEDKAERTMRFCDMFFFDKGFVPNRDDCENEKDQGREENSTTNNSDDESFDFHLTSDDSDDDKNEDEVMADEGSDVIDSANQHLGPNEKIVQDESVQKEVKKNCSKLASKQIKNNFNKVASQSPLQDQKMTTKKLVSPVPGEIMIPSGRLWDSEIARDPECPFRESLRDETACIRWLQFNGLLPRRYRCHRCGTEMLLEKLVKKSNDVVVKEDYFWRCKNNRRRLNSDGTLHPRVRVSAMNGSVFNHSRLSCRQSMVVIYYFARDRTLSREFKKDTGIELMPTSGSIHSTLSLCRQLCLMWLLDHCDKNRTLGSPGSKPVEVIRCDGPGAPTFTLCLVEHDTMEFIVDSCLDREPKTIKDKILKYVNDGVTVFTDLFKALNLPSVCSQFEVDKHNGRLETIVPPTRSLTSVLWKAKLDSVKKGIANQLPSTRLGEYFYRREVERLGQDPFWHFLQVIRTYYPVE